MAEAHEIVARVEGVEVLLQVRPLDELGRILCSKWLPLLGMLLRNSGWASGSGANRAVSASSVSGFTLIVAMGSYRPVAYTKKGAAWKCRPATWFVSNLELLADVQEEAPADEVVLRGRDHRTEQRRDAGAADRADRRRPGIEEVADAGRDFQ